MNREQVVELLESWGVRTPFRLEKEPGDGGRWQVLTRKPARVVDGWLEGTQIDVAWDMGGFRVWTSQRTVAKALAVEHGLKAHLLDGEAEVCVPGALADELLPRFGAKYKRVVTEAMKQRLAKARQNSPVCRK